MSKILMAWEFGGGLGHVGMLRALGAELVRRGHTVTIVTAPGNLKLCHQAFAHSGVEVLPAPTLPISEKRLKYPCTYSDVLHDCGYSSVENVTAIVGEWLKLFDWIGPDLLIAEFSPTALLASCLRTFKTAAAGIGFACPPDMTPLPSLRKEIPEPHWAAEVEQTVLDSMNGAMTEYGGEPLTRVTEIFTRAGRQYLFTLSEMDQYKPWREQAERKATYWPPAVTLPGPRCSWPAGAAVDPASPRVFIYLRESQALLPLLQGLAYKQISTVCVAPRLTLDEQTCFAGTSVWVSSSPVDLSDLTTECSLAVLNGGHTVCDFLRFGVPVMLLPHTLEQQVTADRLSELGAGLYVRNNGLNEIASVLEQLVEDSSYEKSAKTIAKKYANVSDHRTLMQLANDIHELVAS